MKLKDVVDIPLATTQVGMYSRPTWYHYNIRDKGWIEVCSEPTFLEMYTDAVRTIILDQEIAGLDILTDGCVRYDDNLVDGISSWLSNNIAYMGGVRKVEGRPEGKTLMESVLGADNVMAADKVRGYPLGRDGWWWVIEDEPSFGKLGIWPETIKVALPYARRPLKFSAPSASVASRLAINKTQKSDRDIYFDLSRVQNKALREIANTGIKIIQVDYPFALAHWAAQFNELSKDLWKDLIDAFNEEIKGVNAHIWVHFCFGAPILFGEQTPPLAYHMGKVYPHIAECKADCIQSEAANTDGKYLDLELSAWREYLQDKDYAVGAVTPYDLLETNEDVDKIIQKALKYVPSEKLALTSDEGLAGNQFTNRTAAMFKMRLLSTAAKKARKMLGLNRDTLARNEGHTILQKAS